MKSKTERDEDHSYCFMNYFLITIIPMHYSSARLMSHSNAKQEVGQ